MLQGWRGDNPVRRREAAAESAIHRPKISMGYLKLLEERAARSAARGRSKDFACNLAVSFVCYGQRSSDMLRAFVGERRAAAESAKRHAELSVQSLKPLGRCIARSASAGRQQELRKQTVVSIGKNVGRISLNISTYYICNHPSSVVRAYK